MSGKRQKYINHRGVVKAIDPYFVTVEFLTPSACSSCHAKAVCGGEEGKLREVEVELTPGQQFEVGEEVNIRMELVLGYKAIWISYLIPLLILMALLLSLPTIGLSELATALTIIATVSLYYFVVWLLRDRLKREFLFIIEKEYSDE